MRNLQNMKRKKNKLIKCDQTQTRKKLVQLLTNSFDKGEIKEPVIR